MSATSSVDNGMINAYRGMVNDVLDRILYDEFTPITVNNFITSLFRVIGSAEDMNISSDESNEEKFASLKELLAKDEESRDAWGLKNEEEHDYFLTMVTTVSSVYAKTLSGKTKQQIEEDFAVHTQVASTAREERKRFNQERERAESNFSNDPLRHTVEEPEILTIGKETYLENIKGSFRSAYLEDLAKLELEPTELYLENRVFVFSHPEEFLYFLCQSILLNQIFSLSTETLECLVNNFRNVQKLFIIKDFDPKKWISVDQSHMRATVICLEDVKWLKDRDISITSIIEMPPNVFAAIVKNYLTFDQLVEYKGFQLKPFIEKLIEISTEKEVCPNLFLHSLSAWVFDRKKPLNEFLDLAENLITQNKSFLLIAYEVVFTLLNLGMKWENILNLQYTDIEFLQLNCPLLRRFVEKNSDISVEKLYKFSSTKVQLILMNQDKFAELSSYSLEDLSRLSDKDFEEYLFAPAKRIKRS